MASYAKQAQDDSLLNMAKRIQARAYERCGELLQQIEPGKNRFDSRDGDDPPNRITAAGLSERQRKTALRIASVSVCSYASPSGSLPARRSSAICGSSQVSAFSSIKKSIASSISSPHHARRGNAEHGSIAARPIDRS
jgi:hypothetical protein